MRVYFVSLGGGLLVGIVYGLLNVRSPAPPRSPEGAHSYDNLAIYEDCLKSAEGVWRFASRSYRYIWLNEAPLLGRSFPLRARSIPNQPEPMQCPPHLSITTV